MDTEANCSICTRRASQEGGNGSCVIRELYEARRKLTSHNCHGFRPKRIRGFSKAQMQPPKQRKVNLPEALF